MNYGYAPLDAATEKLSLEAKDEENRCCIQLYHAVASAIDLKGLDVLEVGSDRGGGIDYIKRYLGPKRIVGVDLSRNVVAFCNRKTILQTVLLSFFTLISTKKKLLIFSEKSYGIWG